MIQKTVNSDKVVSFMQSSGITNQYGISALLGNMYAESGVNPKNLQNSYNTKWNITDDQYIKKVDAGTWKDPQGRPFGSDRGGFGLCQWTSVGRKTGLQNYANSIHVSIGDIAMQLNWLMQELKSPGYKKVLDSINNCKSVKECSDVIVKSFERPKNQSEAALKRRAGYGEQYYDLYFKESAKPAASTVTKVTVEYVVVKGDTLSKIAAKFNTTVADIAKLNNIANVNSIKVGQKIVVPCNETSHAAEDIIKSSTLATVESVVDAVAAITEPAKVVVENKTTEAPSTYTVQKGDSLSKIGKKVGIAWKDIAKLNGIKWPYIVRKGQILKLK